MIQMFVMGYDEGSDTFDVSLLYLSSNHPPIGNQTVPAMLMPALTGEYGDPSEIVDRVFTIQLS